MYNQPMYFFKSIEDGSDPKLEDGQILIKNVSNRLLRCATPPFMVQPNGFAVVSVNDPTTQARLAQGLVVTINATVATSASVASKVSKKSQKKNVEEVVVEETVVEETVVEATVAEAASETNKETTARYEPKEVQY